MSNLLRPPRVPESVFSLCGYFFPRLLFLHSRLAPQVHWGDISVALQNFPAHKLDLSSAEFWEEWMERWSGVGERYVELAIASSTLGGEARAYRSAAACFHWAEFMYFSDATRKTQLRKKVRHCFERSISDVDLSLTRGQIIVNDITIPYYLILPPNDPASGQTFPCVIMSNGLDSMTEVEIFSFAEQYLERGVATLLFDGPGQGIQVGQTPLQFNIETVVAELLQVLRRNRRIDSDRLGFFGVSFGGYFALRVAQRFGSEFKCVVNISGGPRVANYHGLPRRLKEDFRFAFMSEAAEMQSRLDALVLESGGPCDCEVFSVHGGLDDIFPLADLIEFTRPWGSRHLLKVYPTEAHVCLNFINHYSIETADWAAEKLAPKRQYYGVVASRDQELMYEQSLL